MNEKMKNNILRIICDYIYPNDYVQLERLLASNELNQARVLISKYHDIYSGEIESYEKNENYFEQVDKAYDIILELIFEDISLPLV